ncbi:ATP-binding cassette domain-containing protein [Fundidesulfovibrio soli]|uniref:ATP-binding cassette domain-containing protein n=1 Tax=Fundidesulfovibrio soli TaxID=2922716 RepID=UPI001FAF0872|nr:ATP-binding cassette domain-containing protein [Fundidesulfovibrio soli]
MSGPLVYEISGLEHRFGDRVATRCEHLAVEQGGIVGLRGPNGAGKSTLLAIMAFLLAPSTGEVLFMGRPGLCGDPALRRQAVLMPQDPALLRRRVEDNVLYGLRVRGREDPGSLRQALELVGLDPQTYRRRWWWELSGGEGRRVALAARLALNPLVLLLDEPTASLDPQSSELVRRAVLSARDKRGLTCVVVSHDPQWLESLCDVIHTVEPWAAEPQAAIP